MMLLIDCKAQAGTKERNGERGDGTNRSRLRMEKTMQFVTHSQSTVGTDEDDSQYTCISVNHHSYGTAHCMSE